LFLVLILDVTNNFLALIIFASVNRLERIAGSWRWRAQVQ
jgi:hypothetical protein